MHLLCSKSLRNGGVESIIIVFHPQISFGLVWFGLVVFFFFNFRYGGMTVTKETKVIVSSPSRTEDLCFGKRRLNFCASRWLVEVSLEVVKPRLTARLCDCCFHCGTTCYWPFYAKVKVDWC